MHTNNVKSNEPNDLIEANHFNKPSINEIEL